MNVRLLLFPGLGHTCSRRSQTGNTAKLNFERIKICASTRQGDAVCARFSPRFLIATGVFGWTLNLFNFCVQFEVKTLKVYRKYVLTAALKPGHYDQSLSSKIQTVRHLQSPCFIIDTPIQMPNRLSVHCRVKKEEKQFSADFNILRCRGSWNGLVYRLL